MKRLLTGPLLRIAVSLGALAVICYFLRGKLNESFAILRGDVDWKWLGVAALGYWIVQVIMAYRLYRIFRIQDVILTYGQTFYLCVVGLFFNLFLPSALGGDVAKLYYAYRHSGKKIETATAILVDRLVGLTAISLIALVAILRLQLKGELPDPRIGYVAFVFLGVIAVMLFCFANERLAFFFKRFAFLVPSHKIRDILGKLYSAIHGCHAHGKVLAFCVGISIAGQFVLIMLYYWVARALKLDLSPIVFFMLVPMVNVASMAPSLGGLGVREAGAIAFFSMYMPSEMALAHSLLMNILIYGSGIASGLVFAMRGGLKPGTISRMGAAVQEPPLA
ncbi:MAG TPA: lysylphosphatidylglycerol synthase transmembrane domain-containing protein [Verrucomicrobiae bacterium]|jgi:uncharacterized protein (TIRG00374 family)|nr:lysylphosphatidylglycerol synthase transmembrane domain-containing protein [Verrucomicrobiae bacterium]